MLVKLHQIAMRLRFMRIPGLVVGIGSAALTVYLLLSNSQATNDYLELFILMTLWGLMLFAYIELFQKIPSPVLPHDSFLERIVTRLKLFAYGVLGALVILASIMLFWLSFRLISL